MRAHLRFNMAAVRKSIRTLTRYFKRNSLRDVLSEDNTKYAPLKCSTLIAGATVASYFLWKYRKSLNKCSIQALPSVSASNKVSEGDVGVAQMSYREVRFNQFASVEYKNQVYMTPQDFLESVTEELPRPRIGRYRLTEEETKQWLKGTPSIKYGSNKFFRNLHNRGLISYTEYLFLLCVLTNRGDAPVYQNTGLQKGEEPQSGFRIAFNMFDTDGNQIVDRKEFLVLESFFTLPPKERKFVPRHPTKMAELLNLEGVFSKKTSPDDPAVQDADVSEKKTLEAVQETSLLIHFFGPKGNQVLKYPQFHKFMEDLQNEVIELEFMEFSKGMATISEVDFAQILLRYTLMDDADREVCLDRLREKMPSEQGITLPEFRQFCQFLNNLDDFTIAMKLYTLADQAVNKETFQRAVYVCTGHFLSPHLVDTVFHIFDADDDGHLSHKEFISKMKDRLQRGSKSHLIKKQDPWTAYKSCVKNEMKSI